MSRQGGATDLGFGVGGGLDGLLGGIAPVHDVLEEAVDVGDHLCSAEEEGPLRQQQQPSPLRCIRQ